MHAPSLIVFAPETWKKYQVEVHDNFHCTAWRVHSAANLWGAVCVKTQFLW